MCQNNYNRKKEEKKYQHLNYVDVNLKKEFHNKTTGVLLVRENNKWLIKYINNNDIVVREFITSN